MTEKFSNLNPYSRWVLEYDSGLASGEASTIQDAPTGQEFNNRLIRIRRVLDLLEEDRRLQNEISTKHFVEEYNSFSIDPETGAGQLGRFRLLRELGRGGGGIVFLAEDPQLQRQVALKVPKLEHLLESDGKKRFLREAQAAAGLDHPNIVTVFEAGESETLIFIVSAYCEGPSLKDWLRENDDPIPPRTAANLIAILADALGYTHQQGIVHRDIKPGNVLLFPIDQVQDQQRSSTVSLPGKDKTYLPAISDFGLAKVFNTDETATGSGVIVGTPAYMAPEQAEGKTREVGPECDVYALGVILYELLTGSPPFRGVTVPDTLSQVIGKEPVRPRSLQPQIPRDLETICLKCLKKRSSQRYTSAGELREELQRYQDNRPIQARRTNFLESGLAWCRRNPMVASLTAVSVIGVLLFIGLQAERYQREIAEEKIAMKDRLVKAEQGAKQNALKAERLAKQLAINQKFHALVNQAKERIATGQKGWSMDSLKDLQKAATLDAKVENVIDLRSATIQCLAGVDLHEPKILLKRRAWTGALAFSPDGKQLAVANYLVPVNGLPCSVLLLESETGRVERKLSFPTYSGDLLTNTRRDGARAMAYSADGKYLAVGTYRGHLHLWDLSEKVAKPSSVKVTDKEIGFVSFRPQGDSVFVYDKGGAIQRRAIPDIRQTLAKQHVRAFHSTLGFSPDGNNLVFGDEEKIAFLNVETLKDKEEKLGRIFSACYSPDGRFVALEAAHKIHFFSAKTQKPFRVLYRPGMNIAHPSHNIFLQFSRDGSLVLSMGGDRGIYLWEVCSGKLLATVVADPGGPLVVSFNHKGDAIVLANLGFVKSYKIHGIRNQSRIAHLHQPISNITLSADGKTLATTALTDIYLERDPWISMWELPTGKWKDSYSGRPDGFPLPTALHPTNDCLAYGYSKHRLYIKKSKESRVKEYSASQLTKLRFSPNGKLWGIIDGNVLTCWDWKTGKEIHRESILGMQTFAGTSTVNDLAAGNKYVVTAGHVGDAWIIPADDSKKPRKPISSLINIPLECATINPAESVAAFGAHSGDVLLVSVPDGKKLRRLKDHVQHVMAMSFSPDGLLFATGGKDSVIIVYLVQKNSVEMLFKYRTFGPVQDLRFHSSGKLLFVVQGETGVRVLDLDSIRNSLGKMKLWPT